MNDKQPETQTTEHWHPPQQHHNHNSIHHRSHHDGVFGGVFLIFLGVVFILINTGVLPGNIWRYFSEYWPLVLILLGVDMLLRSTFVGRIVASLIAIAIAAYLIVSALYIYRPATYMELRRQVPWLPYFLPVQRPQRELIEPNVIITPDGERIYQN